MQLPNGPELVWTMVGVWLAGGVYVPVNPRNPASEVDAVLADDRARRRWSPSDGIERRGRSAAATRTTSRS